MATKKTAKALGLATLEKIHAEGKAKAAASRKRRAPGQRAPIYKEPLRAQQKGPIHSRPTDWVVCVSCTRMFSTPEETVRYGTRKRHVVKHLSDHKMGRIKLVETTPATDARDARHAAKKTAKTAR